ncbi:MAG: MqnA/MqnD/SBP family protein [Phycisphaerae bacterium]
MSHTAADTRRLIRCGHSPDPDDAFMFYALASDRIDTGPYRFVHEMADIETLNRRAESAELELSAISLHAYPFVARHYALLASGCSMGDGYGPIVVARHPLPLSELAGRTIAVPGERTTAFLALSLCLGVGNFRAVVKPFDTILDAVQRGEVDAGLIIHEGQLTYRSAGLHAVIDLGVWWLERTDLPLPLGGNVVRRDLGPAAMRQVAALLRQSIEYGLAHRDEAVEYALAFGRDLDRPLTDRFVGMYVNKWTVDYGERGRAAVRALLVAGHSAGLVPEVGEIEFIA